MAITVESLRELRRVPSLIVPALPRVLLAGFAAEEAGELAQRLAGCCEVRTAALSEEARETLEGGPVAVLALGPRLALAESRRLASEAPGGVLALLTGAGPDAGLFQDLIDEDRIFYLSLGALPATELSELIRSALEPRRAESPAPAGAPRVLQAARRMAQQPDLESAGEILQVAVEETVEADRGYCLLYDPVAETLWSRGTGLAAEERRESAAVGLVSFVVRTARSLRVERLTADPRYESQADDPRGGRGEQLLATPVLAPGGQVLAVLSAVRDAGKAPFSAAEQAKLETLAATVAPLLAQIELEVRTEREARRRNQAFREQTSDLFRAEALEHHSAAGLREGSWLRIFPRWMGATFWLLAGLVSASLAYVLFGTVDQHVSGPAVVRVSGRAAAVTALLPGQHRLLLRPGLPLSLKLPGYDQAPRLLEVAAVGDVIGPQEAWRRLGPEVAGAVPLSGPVVLVQARLPGPVFEADGGTHALYDGMWGTAEVRVRSQPLLPLLVPGLKALPERGDG